MKKKHFILIIIFSLPVLVFCIPCGTKAQNEQCISKDEYQQVRSQINMNVPRLIQSGKLKIPDQQGIAAQPVLSWPLKEADHFKDYDYYTISNYPDHDATAGIQDYNCGLRTYDGHLGTDIALSPFPWRMMDNQVVNVIAAAPGTIVAKSDGQFDQRCSQGNFTANYVIIQHDDGSRALYWHMKNGSVTVKDTGTYIYRGEYLGKVGSSGQSTGPHLHFEIYAADSTLKDPFAGSCNLWNGATWWSVQTPYWNSGILRLMTGSSNLPSNTCPNVETTNEKNHFAANDSIYFYVFFRDIQMNQQVNLNVYNPQGSLTFTGTFIHTGPNQNYWNSSWGRKLASNAPGGTWKITVSYNGANYVHYFTVGCPASYSPNITHLGQNGFVTGDAINSSATCSVGSETWYEAQNEIIFSTGFIALNGSSLRTFIDACSIGGTRIFSEENAVHENNFILSPVPATDELNITYRVSENTFISESVTDLMGRSIFKIKENEVMQEGLHLEKINVSSLPPGVYLLWISKGNDQRYFKFVIAR